MRSKMSNFNSDKHFSTCISKNKSSGLLSKNPGWNLGNFRIRNQNVEVIFPSLQEWNGKFPIRTHRCQKEGRENRRYEELCYCLFDIFFLPQKIANLTAGCSIRQASIKLPKHHIMKRFQGRDSTFSTLPCPCPLCLHKSKDIQLQNFKHNFHMCTRVPVCV